MMKRVLLCVVLAVTFLLVVGHARTQELHRAGTVRLDAMGGRGLLELRSSRDGFSGELSIVNLGKEPLVVSRIAVRGDAANPRSPPKVVARLAEGALPVTIAPGATRKALVQWVPERGVRLRQLFAHVVTTSDEQSGEVAMGVRAQVGGWLGPLEGHVLSLLIGIPLLGALLTILVRALGRRDDRTPHLIALVSLAAQSALAAYVYRGFASDVSRLDGNDGLQFVEHGVSIRGLSAEIFFGVDGTGVAALLVTSMVAFLAILPERTMPRGAAGYHAAYLVLAAAVPGALCAMDGLLFRALHLGGRGLVVAARRRVRRGRASRGGDEARASRRDTRSSCCWSPFSRSPVRRTRPSSSTARKRARHSACRSSRAWPSARRARSCSGPRS